METTRRLSIGYPPPHLDSSGMSKPGLGTHVGCRSTGPLITFIELELRQWVRLWGWAKAEVLDKTTANATITKARNLGPAGTLDAFVGRQNSNALSMFHR